MNDISRMLHVLKERKNENFVLVTVIAVEGSAYRHEGAKMLINEKGETYGIISGGCLETDLIHHALEIFETGKSKVLTYNLTSEDDAGWGQGAGCNGIVNLYLEITGWEIWKDENGRAAWEWLDDRLNSGSSVISVKLMSENNDSDDWFYYCEDGTFFKRINYIDENIPDLKNFFAGEGQIKIIALENDERVLLELYTPRVPLFVFGAGPDVEPLVELASKLDFSIHLIDPRPERCNKENFPMANHFIVDFPHTYLDGNKLPKNSFVLVMTHHFQRDKDILHRIRSYPPDYLGILGPKERTRRLLHPNLLHGNIHSPVGLEIFAEGPEEIAVSICAELIKVKNRKKAGITG